MAEDIGTIQKRNEISSQDSETKSTPQNIGENTNTMNFGEKSRVMEVLNRAFAGNVVERRVAAAAIREFEGMLDELYNKPPKWDLVTLPKEEVENMRDTIRYQARKLTEITTRVNDISHGHLPREPIPTEKQKLDFIRRVDLAETFNSIYDTEWRKAYRELSDHHRMKELDIIYTLLRIIRTACDLCYDLSCDQLDKLVVDMENNMINPVNGNQNRFREVYSDPAVKYTPGMMEAEKIAMEYRQKRAQASVEAVVELYMRTKMKTVFQEELRRELKGYAEKCVETIWLMTAMNPPMRLYWQQQTERLHNEIFSVYDRRGDFVNQTVWPAVFEHSTGRLLCKGVVLAM